VSLSLILSTNELFESGGFGPLPSQPLLKELAENQQKNILKIPGASSQDEEALRSALAILESRGLDAAVVIEAVNQVVNNPLLVETLTEQVARALSSDKALMIIVTEVATKYPSLAISIATGAAGGVPRLALTVAAAVAATFPKLATAISYAAAEAAPEYAREIAQAVAAVVPDQRDMVFAAVRSVTGLRLDLAALGLSTGQAINPANYVSGTGPSAQSAATAPSAVQPESPGPTSSSSGPPLIEVISPEN
jgi:hypothetical protein